jgi:hypothetical protein
MLVRSVVKDIDRSQHDSVVVGTLAPIIAKKVGGGYNLKHSRDGVKGKFSAPALRGDACDKLLSNYGAIIDEIGEQCCLSKAKCEAHRTVFDSYAAFQSQASGWSQPKHGKSLLDLARDYHDAKMKSSEHGEISLIVYDHLKTCGICLISKIFGTCKHAICEQLERFNQSTARNINFTPGGNTAVIFKNSIIIVLNLCELISFFLFSAKQSDAQKYGLLIESWDSKRKIVGM